MVFTVSLPRGGRALASSSEFRYALVADSAQPGASNALEGRNSQLAFECCRLGAIDILRSEIANETIKAVQPGTHRRKFFEKESGGNTDEAAEQDVECLAGNTVSSLAQPKGKAHGFAIGGANLNTQ